MQREVDSGPRWDKCAAHAVKSLGAGLALGLIASTVIFRRKRWAFLLGVGYGCGLAFAGCDYELNQKKPLPVCERSKKDKKSKKKKDNVIERSETNEAGGKSCRKL